MCSLIAKNISRERIKKLNFLSEKREQNRKAKKSDNRASERSHRSLLANFKPVAR